MGNGIKKDGVKHLRIQDEENCMKKDRSAHLQIPECADRLGSDRYEHSLKDEKGAWK